MKKIILSCAALAFAAATLVSCGENKEAAVESTTSTTTVEQTPAATTPPPATNVATDAPTFSNEEVNKSLAEYKMLISDYSAAVAAKDNAKIQEFTTKYQAWAQNASTLAAKLKPEEAQKYGEYMTKLSQEWAAAAQSAMAK